ncbi:S8 family serine peptidase [Streptomyces sp. SID12501]|uniref:S8 family serine peptidase n=1 Tax=Streptomyces sp. SID12501 TaxID=2706042 RepID=A0A6B3C2L0_9ACTN|nr:S8 family serine peptidase [Streptomyces sp. SID12501]NEC90530.1 S8 family serine peptidase [Streptomyces sp. SID12501]
MRFMRRPLPRLRPARTFAVLLPLVLLAGPAASAADGSPVRLPVMPSRLDADDACTGASTERATSVPWEQQSLQLPRAWQFSAGAGVTVAVVDTGVSTTAPALKGRVTVVGEAGQDCVGHGSFVAGLVAATTVDGVRFAGVAQQARIVAVRGTDARGTATAASVAAGIGAAVDAGAKVIEVSPALVQGSAALTEAVEDAVAHDALVVAAAVPDPPAKSSASSRDTPDPRAYWPAAQEGVLSVLDVDSSGGRPDNALLPRDADLTAPGDGVVGPGPRGGGHYIGSGASFAAGFVAGAAALVRSAHPGLTGAQTAARLVSTAYPDAVPRLDPYAAVTSVGAAERGVAAAVGQEAPVRLPDDPGAAPTRRAVLFAAGGGAVLLLVVWAVVVLPRGRARGWRAGQDLG